ncbi:PREDICTED: uncharacterized protein LOC106314397 [Brassica oleracea var. oleracea]|uniref:uncharacterized protein LOC106314397 n=1 Tax=Brassica oleracea var. oleracea TaxID=109376 RepID=UPI0006A71737|nr:PREDICTED: uncharacterized protein LOC106314397 [Brassica oleracea var. oleracea]
MLLREKSEAFDRFKKFKEYVENQMKLQLKTFRTDRGGEFTYSEFIRFCEENDVTRHLTASYTLSTNVDEEPGSFKLPHIDFTEEGDGDEHQDHQQHEEQNNNEEEEAADADEQEQVVENNDANQDPRVTSRYGRNIRKPKRFDDYILLAEVERTSLNVIKQFKDDMSRSFEMSDLEMLTYYLGIEVTQGADGIHIKQEGYTQGILVKTKMESCNYTHDLMHTSLKVSKAEEEPEIDATSYRSIIGCLRVQERVIEKQ